MWPFGRKRKCMKPEDIAREARLQSVESEAASLRLRAEVVAESLERRLRRNHWADSIAEIARKEQRR